MTKSTDERKQRRVSKLSDRRKKLHRQEVHKDDPPWQLERWFEVIEYFDPHKIVPLRIPDVEQKRMFVMGAVDDLIILHMPEDSNREQAAQAVKALAAQGIRAMAFSDKVQFMRLRMCSPEEEALLNDADKLKEGHVQVVWPPKEDPQPPPESDVLLASERFAKEKADEQSEH